MQNYAENNRFLNVSTISGCTKGILVEKSLFGSKVCINMIALGRIPRYIGVIILLNIAEILPGKFLEKNIGTVN